MFNNQIIAGSSGQGGSFYPYSVDQSLRFNDNDSAYLSRTPASAGNRKTFTFSAWIKLNPAATNYPPLFNAGTSAPDTVIRLDNTGKLQVVLENGGGGNSLLTTSAQLRDPSSWYHIVCTIDTTNATADDRIKIYINGTEQTSYSSRTNPSLNLDTNVNNTVLHKVGAQRYASYWDGYMAEVNFIDGTALDATSFGETINGIWVPKQVSGLTYGTNGFYLSFADSSAIGDDLSGNTNDWTANNLAASDVMLDSPTNNFPTLNPLDQNTGTLSEGNLKVVTVSTSSTPNTRATFAVNSGKWYWEYITLDTQVHHFIGVVRADIYGGIGSDYITATPQGTIYADGSIVQSGLTTWSSSGNILGVSLDADAETVQFYLNGSSYGTAVSYSSFMSGATVSGWFIDGASGIVCTGIANFGQDSTFAGNTTAGGNADANGIGDFKYAPPSGGFLALCSANLDEPAIGPNSATTSDQNFNTVLWSGDGTSSRAITGVGFQPDFTWHKARNNGAQTHQLLDVVRGKIGAAASFARLRTDTTATEATPGTDSGVLSFDSDGFTIGNDSAHNNSSYTYVGWNWKAGGTAVSNTDGSITSSVSANPDAGFSIVSYTGNATAGATVGHGLGVAPDMIIIKNRDGTNPWGVYHSSNTSQPETDYLKLNETTATTDASTIWNDTAPTSSVFTLGSTGMVNTSGDNLIAYCFANTESYLKCGSYVGNGSTNGPFVYTGFRPAWVMIKRTDSTGSWNIADAVRSPYNEVDEQLQANLINAESTTFDFDFLSNGFKARTTDGARNTSGGTYIYLAFAEAPFKYANAR